MAGPYVVAYKGRQGRTGEARFLKDEFDRIAAAFVALQTSQSTSFTTVHNIGSVGTGSLVVDPSNGQFQEVTLTADTVVELVSPIQPETEESITNKITLMIHGSNVQIVNGWGPQVWVNHSAGGSTPERLIFTGLGSDASALMEFIWDGLAWICIAFSRNTTVSSNATQYQFPLTSDLTDVSDAVTLTFDRESYAVVRDHLGFWVHVPNDQPQFVGARYVMNHIAAGSDLQAAVWVGSGVTVATESSAGPAGEDVDRLTFTSSGGRLYQGMIPNYWRPQNATFFSNNEASSLRWVVRFDAKLASGSSNGLRVDMRQNIFATDAVQQVTVTNSWQTFSLVFSSSDFSTQAARDNFFKINDVDDGKVIATVGFRPPSGSLGDPVLVTNVQVTPLREGESTLPPELQDTTLGASMALSADAGSTGSWNDGTKAMALDNGEYVDFSGNLEPGKMYACTISTTSGNMPNLQISNGLTIYDAKKAASGNDKNYSSFLRFTIQYRGGQFRWRLVDSASCACTVNIYEVSNFLGVYETLNGNSVSAGVVTEAVGAPISSDTLKGLRLEPTKQNELPFGRVRRFRAWTTNRLDGTAQTTYADFRLNDSEISIDGFPGQAAFVQDSAPSDAGSIDHSETIAANSSQYSVSMFFRKTVNSAGTQIVTPQNCASAVTTPVSRYVDVSVGMSGGTAIGPNTVRLDLADGTLYAGADLGTGGSGFGAGYVLDSAHVTREGDWYRLEVQITNNGTNTSLDLRVFPARGTGDNNTETASQQGWCIVDWAQVETAPRATSPIIGDNSNDRLSDDVTTGLADGALYDVSNNEVGDVTSGAWSHDDDEPLKNLLYSDGVISASVDNLHEFGTTYEDCVQWLTDENDEAITDSAGNQICTEASTTTVEGVGEGTMADLVDWWSLEESGSNDRVNAHSVTGINWQWNNSTPNTPGAVGNALDWRSVNSIGNYYFLATSADADYNTTTERFQHFINNQGNFAWAFWANHSSLAKASTIFTSGLSGTAALNKRPSGYSFGVNASGKVYFETRDTTVISPLTFNIENQASSGPTTISTGSKHFIVLNWFWATKTLEIWVDAELEDTLAFSQAPLATAVTPSGQRIGSIENNDNLGASQRPALCWLDELAFFHECLSNETIDFLYNGGAGLDYATATA